MAGSAARLVLWWFRPGLGQNDGVTVAGVGVLPHSAVHLSAVASTRRQHLFGAINKRWGPMEAPVGRWASRNRYFWNGRAFGTSHPRPLSDLALWRMEALNSHRTPATSPTP